MKETYDYDVLVLGGGSGGYAAAKEAAAGELKVGLIEAADEMGGLCILRGCMPSKTLIETANRLRAIAEADDFGIDVPAGKLRLDDLRARKERLISDFQHWRVKGMKTGDFNLIRGRGRFIDENTIEVVGEEGTKKLTAGHFVISTGSKISVPPIDGLDDIDYWTSDDVVDIPEVPAETVVMGSGAIGMECAMMLAGLGSKVTVLSRSRPLVSGVEPECSEALLKRCEDVGIEVIFEHTAKSVEKDGERVYLKIEPKEGVEGESRTLECDKLLLATGRKPLTEGIGLEVLGLEAGERIEINEYARTKAAHVFAAGDCASPLEVVHLAVKQGEAAGKNLVRELTGQGEEKTWSMELKMLGIFTDPELVQMGLTEEEAREEGYDVWSETYEFAEQGKGEIVGEKRGLVKMVIDRGSRRILGAAGLGPGVVDHGHAVLVALHQKMTIDAFLDVPFYHPTLGEIWTYVGEEFL